MQLEVPSAKRLANIITGGKNQKPVNRFFHNMAVLDFCTISVVRTPYVGNANIAVRVEIYGDWLLRVVPA